MSQPTLSGQILKLEKELGVDLFERDGKAVRLTVAGGRILAHARRAVTAADDLVAAANIYRDPEAAPLKLGMIPTLAPYLMPLLLPALAEAMARLRLALIEDLAEGLLGPGANGDLDAALIASEPPLPGLRDDLLFDEPFWLVMPHEHTLARYETVAPGLIEPGSLLLLQDGHCLRDQALDLCQRPAKGADVMADMRATSLDTLLQMAGAGYGLTLLPHLAISRGTPLPNALVARRIEGEHASRRVRIVSRPSSARRATIDKVAAIIAQCLPKGTVPLLA